ncbi:hypothetical protein [Syntrophorhabdus aromaticivorans]|uniref:Uncharacterized protein n=1 Tax=Syntrophorhabdus aromaticivorans TaxID=328301 RepID=A0A351U4Z9_9BACT|nr:hypothetical protein [Syntrophorhabdus aromaticivorans]NLW36020.1 hypothetical protein [Syntrophorhabdus aromaticivorans]HBA55030.1 hypothetical protein [Syntrophorhabdus aromaticivorans]
MARELILETVVKPDSRTMEERLIEVFGCLPLNDRVIWLDGGAERKKIESDVYPDIMEERLIEVFGCSPLSDRVIRLDGGAERKKAAQLPVVRGKPFARVAGIA